MSTTRIQAGRRAPLDFGQVLDHPVSDQVTVRLSRGLASVGGRYSVVVLGGGHRHAEPGWVADYADEFTASMEATRAAGAFRAWSSGEAIESRKTDLTFDINSERDQARRAELVAEHESLLTLVQMRRLGELLNGLGGNR